MNALSQIKPYQNQNISQQNSRNNKDLDQKNAANSTLKGVLLTKYYDDKNYEPNPNIIIPTLDTNNPQPETQSQPTKSFDVKKALLPLVIGSAGLLGGIAGLSYLLKASAKASLKASSAEKLPDLALNMNIKQEPQFAAYMLLRSPNTKTLMGAVGVFAMSGITLVFKNLVDGVKDIWIKKQESDIQRDFQEKMISTETKVFSGKLQVERTILSETAHYFDKVFNSKDKKQPSFNKMPKAFKSINNFCANPDTSKNTAKNNKKENILFGLALAGTTIGGLLLGKLTMKNLKDTASITEKYTQEFTEKTADAIEKIAEKKNPEDYEKVSQLFEAILATPESIRKTFAKMNIPEEKIQATIARTEAKKKSIFAEAPEALGGIATKIQYYCYLDEDRGHLYNMILHPENKFLRYFFMASAGITSIGYIGKQCLDAIRAVAVNKENTDTELSLQNRLIDVEVRNFKAKKDVAVKPLIEEFDKKKAQGAPEEDLKTMADNILVEIKNSAPFVYT